MTRRTAEAPLTPLEAKAAAIARVQARRRPARFAEMPDPNGGTFRWQVDGGGDFLPAQDLNQYLDDRVARCVLGSGACDVLISMLERFRGGAAAVPDAVSLAAGLDAWAQFSIWMVVGSMPGGPGGTDMLKAQIGREWRKRGLQMVPPPVAQVEPRDLNAPRPTVTRYRSELGHPAGMAV